MNKIKKFVNNRAFSCNLYILSSEKGNLIIDPGYYDKSIEDYIELIGGIDYVLLTHGHFDHIMGINQLNQKYPNISYFAFKDELQLIMKPAYNCSSHLNIKYIPEVDINLLDEGNVQIGQYQIQVISTPGHTKGSAMFYFKDENILFTGDTIICESIGRTDLPTGSDADMYNTLEKIKRLNFKDDTKVCFGHGKDFSYSQLLEKNIYLQKK